MTEPVKEKIGYAFRIGAQTGDGISIDITGNFPIGAPDEVINVELDKWINIFSRQRAKEVLMKEQDLLNRDKAQHAMAVEELRLASEKENTKSAEKMQLQSMKQSVARFEQQVANRERGIESLKTLI
jgi:hypothetical protein